MIEYGNEKFPDISEDLVRMAVAIGMQVVTVVCVPKGDMAATSNCVTFIALVPSIPRIGEIITLQDKRQCLVKLVDWKVRVGHSDSGKANVITLNAYVVAMDLRDQVTVDLPV